MKLGYLAPSPSLFSSADSIPQTVDVNTLILSHDSIYNNLLKNGASEHQPSYNYSDKDSVRVLW